jgi:acyl dehydratase
LSQTYRFANPVFIDDEITASLEIKSIQPDASIVELSARVTRSDGVTVLEGEIWVYLATPSEP